MRSKTQWLYFSGKLMPGNPTTQKTLKALDPGVYSVGESMMGAFLQQLERPVRDQLVDVECGAATSILAEIDKFWSRREAYDQWGYRHARGILLHGRPGTGKTCLISILCDRIIAAGGIVLRAKHSGDFHPVMQLVTGTQLIREVEPDRPLVTVMEDVESAAGGYEEQLLDYLDGSDSINHVVNVATTNMLEAIPNRLCNRPRRYDLVVEIGPPLEEERVVFFEKKGVAGDEARAWAKRTDGFSYALLSELIVTVKCLDYTLNQALKSLRPKAKALADGSMDESMTRRMRQPRFGIDMATGRLSFG